MQMKIVVDTPEDYKKWLSDKVALVKEVKAANEPAPAEGNGSDSTSIASDTAAAKTAMK